MSEDASQAAATAAGGNDSATVVHSSGGGGNAALNPVFRTAPALDQATRQGTATQKPAGRRGATQDRTGSPGAEELLADAVSDDGIDPNLETDTKEYWQARAKQWENRRTPELKAMKTELAQYSEKARQWDEHEESQKTEQQKFADRAAAAEQRAAEADARYHRTLAAATYDLPVSMIDHLGTGTEDEILARAETFAQAINERAEVIAAAQAQAAAQQQPRNGNGGGFRPVESLRPGALPASDNKPNDANAWMRQALGRRK